MDEVIRWDGKRGGGACRPIAIILVGNLADGEAEIAATEGEAVAAALCTCTVCRGPDGAESAAPAVAPGSG